VGLGEIAHTGRGHTYVGDYVGGAERAEIVAEALSGGRWETTASPTVATEIWKKLILNSVSLPLSSLARLRTEGLVECEPVAELADAVARESCAVARAAGYDIDDDERIAVIRATHLRAGKGKTSMLQDVEALRATEIQVVNGAVVRAADAAGVEAPLNKALAQLVSGLEQGWKAPFGAAN
jgi:2-dehydropantoate 2-reductase